MNKATTKSQVTGSSESTLPSKKKDEQVGGKSKAKASETSMSRSGDVQESNKSVAADDTKQTRKDRWKKAFVDKLSKVNQREYLSIYDPQRKRKIRGEVCIYRVPDKLRQVKDEAYRPSIVSIGPFHEKDRKLAAMAQYKLAYMLSFLDQQSKVPQDSGDPRESHSRKSATKCLEDCIEAICGLDEVVRQCYAEDIDYTEDALAEILLLDGCFILELFFRFDQNLGYMKQEDYKSDPVLRSAWTIAALQHDLALLENQIPFFVLELLYDTIKPHVLKCKLPPSLTSLALKFFQPVSRKEMKEAPPAGATEFKHLLDLLHKFYFHPTGHLSIKVDQIISGNQNCSALQQVISSLLSKMKREKQPPSLTAHQDDPLSNGKWEFKYCASQLLESGIEFKVGPNSQQHLLEITLEGGVIIIPQLHINETTSSLFRNLIAFEQCSLKSTHSVTSYAFLLKSLITTTGDSKLLGAREIIQHNNRIGHKEYLAQFESILDEVALKDDFCFGALFDQVNKYCMSWYSWSRIRVFLWVQFQRQKRILCTTYFSTTWKVISLMAAVFLLVLTSVQTYFTVYPR